MFSANMPDTSTYKPTLLDRIDSILDRNKRWLFLLFAAAFGLKMIYILQSTGSLQTQVPILDAKYYDDMAQDIAAGNIIRKEAFFMGPLYPYFLALIYSIFGRSFLLLGMIQIAGGAGTVVLTYLIGRSVFRPSVALLGAVLLGFYGASTFYEGQFLMMWLGTFLNMLLLYVLLSDFKDRYLLKYCVAGALLGLSALARANILIFLPVVLLWLLCVARVKRRVLAAAVFAAAAFAVIAPATIHNYVASKDFVLITSNGGMNFYIGNNAEAAGAFYPPKGVDFISDTTTRRYVERMLGRDMKPSEISRYWFGQGWEFIRNEPGREVALLARKTALFFNGYELPQIESYDISKKRYAIFKALLVNFWIIGALGIAGIICSARRWKQLYLLHWFILSYSLSIILFFVTARYRVQIVPVLSLFAAFTIAEVLPRTFLRAPRRFVPLLLVGAILLLTRPGLFAFDRDHMLWREHIHEARRWNTVGETENALQEINKAVALQPGDPESYIHRAIIYKESGMLFQAVEDYSRALEIYPAMPSIHYDLGQVLRRVRMYPAAVEEYLKAIAEDSLMIEAHNNLGITYRLMKEYDLAVAYFKRVIEMDPRYIKAYNNVGALLAETGDIDGAIEYFSMAIERDPGYAHSYKNIAMAFIEKKQLLDARQNLERYLELEPGDTAAAEILHKVLVAIEAN
jgi:tetratricopeptide (TPR) repeat protein